jgi:P63C domain
MPATRRLIMAGFGSSGAASMGGKARAKLLTEEERSDSARLAAQARWVKTPIPKATHEGPLSIGNMSIDSAVLEDKTRVLSERAFSRALDVSRGGYQYRQRSKVDGGGDLPIFLAVKSLKDFIGDDLRAAVEKPKLYTTLTGGRPANGIDAKLIPLICDVWLKARDAKALSESHLKVAAKADILMRGLATVGIIALIDEATGYQYERPQKELEDQLRTFLSENLVRYASGFPHDYLKHLCRLKGVELRPDMRLPQYFGHLTGDLVYKRIAPGLLRALKERRAEKGKPGNKLYQWTSEDRGYPALMMQIGTVVGLMKIHTDYDAFKKQLDQAAPKYLDVPGLFDNAEDWEEPRK